MHDDKPKPTSKPTRPETLHDPLSGVPADPKAPTTQPTRPGSDREELREDDDD